MYQFSAPMPYNKEDIDKLLTINNQVEKCEITSLYASLPSNCTLFTGFEQARNIQSGKQNFDYWKNLFSYTLENNLDFIYLLNSPIPFDLNNDDFEKMLDKLDKLLNELSNMGIKKIRVANPQLISYLWKNYNKFDIFASTSLEYKHISEYQNLILMHPEIKQIVPSHDINKNFKILKNLKKDYPNVEIEIMVNEGCIQGCPHRNLHAGASIDKLITYKDNLALSTKYYTLYCSYILKKYPFLCLTLNNNIYPWELKEYAKIGINKFKLVGRDGYTFGFESYLNDFLLYFKGAENIKNVEEVSITTFIHHLQTSKELFQLKTKDIHSILPNINHFKKYGHLCASRCGVQCRYCYKCAEKIQKVFEKKATEKEKIPKYVSACKITT